MGIERQVNYSITARRNQFNSYIQFRVGNEGIILQLANFQKSRAPKHNILSLYVDSIQ